MLKSIWRTCCSLKLAIILASIATLLAMGGSLVMHFNPAVFAGLDTSTLAEWTQRSGRSNPGLSWWLYATGILIILLALNTVCCFIDWLFVIQSRWRKSGEYLIHLGFVLVVTAYFWASFAGARSDGNQVAEGQMIPLKVMPGHYLRLDKFEPVLNAQRRPIDMLNTVSLLKGDKVVASGIVKTNTPLQHDGLVITPASFGRQTIGFEVLVPSMGKGYRLITGDAIPLNNDLRVVADAFLPDAVESGGKVFNRSNDVREPAYLMRLLKDGEEQWRGWYFLSGPLPKGLQGIGLQLVIRKPVYQTISYLTINHDPGAKLALIGGICISLGVCFALFSFYYKRSRGDRPDII
jgi:cytochrome c biogenesis protein